MGMGLAGEGGYGGDDFGGPEDRIMVACRVKPRVLPGGQQAVNAEAAPGSGSGASGVGGWRRGLFGGGGGLGGGAMSSPACVSVSPDQRTVAWAGERADGVGAKHFTFDYAAGERVDQEELFEKIGRPVTNACLEGFNGTIFCYGQTGSGKTFTTFGPPDDADDDGGGSGGGSGSVRKTPGTPRLSPAQGEKSRSSTPAGGGGPKAPSPGGGRREPSPGSKAGKKEGGGAAESMTGEDRGLVPRVLEYLFDRSSAGAALGEAGRGG
ncbi:unnamed protein product, partial [Scytosiphon promiscuus]